MKNSETNKNNSQDSGKGLMHFILMRKRLFSAFLATGLLVIYVACASEIETDKKAGMNGSFEVVKSGRPVNWYFERLAESLEPSDKADNNFSIISDIEDYKDGHRSLKFDVKKCSDIGGNKSPGIFQEFEAEPGADYKVSFWMKNKQAGYKATVSAITLKGGSKEENKPSVVAGNEDITEWRQYSVVQHIPSDLDRLRFELSVVKPGVLQLDDIRIEKLPR